MEEYHGEERRKPLSQKEVEDIKQQILSSVYEDIGKRGIVGVLWIIGALVTAALAWIAARGHFTIN